MQFPGCGRMTHLNRVSAVIAKGKHPVPFRTRKLSSSAPMVLRGGPRGRVGRRRTYLKRVAPHMWSSGPLRLSGYCGGRCWRLVSWLRDAERPRGVEQAVLAAPSRKRPALAPGRRKPRAGARDRPEPADPGATAEAGRPPTGRGRNRVPVAPAEPGHRATARVATVRGAGPGHRPVTARALALGPRPVTVGDLALGLRPATPRAGPGGPLPSRVGQRPTGPGAHPGDPSAPGPAEPARVPAVSAAIRLLVRGSARTRRAPASSENHCQGQHGDRGRGPARAGAGGQPLVPGAGRGTGTRTRPRRVRHAAGPPTAPPNVPRPAGPGPHDPTATAPAPQSRGGRTDTGPRDPTRTGPAPGGRGRTGPGARDPTLIAPAPQGRGRTGPGHRSPARITRPGAGRTGPGTGRTRGGQADPVSRTRSSRPSLLPRRAPSCTACRTTWPTPWPATWSPRGWPRTPSKATSMPRPPSAWPPGSAWSGRRPGSPPIRPDSGPKPWLSSGPRAG